MSAQRVLTARHWHGLIAKRDRLPAIAQAFGPAEASRGALGHLPCRDLQRCRRCAGIPQGCARLAQRARRIAALGRQSGRRSRTCAFIRERKGGHQVQPARYVHEALQEPPVGPDLVRGAAGDVHADGAAGDGGSHGAGSKHRDARERHPQVSLDALRRRPRADPLNEDWQAALDSGDARAEGAPTLLEGRGFPKVDGLMGGRYVPAVRAFFDREYGLLPRGSLVASAPHQPAKLGAYANERAARKTSCSSTDTTTPAQGAKLIAKGRTAYETGPGPQKSYGSQQCRHPM